MRHRTNIGAACSVMLAALLIASACSTGGGGSNARKQGQRKETVKVGVGNPIFSYAPMFVGDAKGFWKDEGIKIKPIVFNSGSAEAQALLSDSIMLGAGSMAEPINLSSQGTPTVVFGFIDAALPYRLMARPDISNVHQLTGKTVGVSRSGSLSDLLSHIVLKEAGIDPSKATYQQAGSSPSRLAALESGAIDAALLDSPSYQLAQKAGMNTLLNVATELQGFPYEVLYAKKSTIQTKHKVFLRFMRGYIHAAKYTTDPANKDEVVSIVAKATGQKVHDLKIAYDETIKDFPPTGKPMRKGIQAMLAGTKEFGDVKGVDKITADDLYYPGLWNVTGRTTHE